MITVEDAASEIRALRRIVERLQNDHTVARRHVLNGEYSHEAGIAVGIAHALAVISDETGPLLRKNRSEDVASNATSPDLGG